MASARRLLVVTDVSFHHALVLGIVAVAGVVALTPLGRSAEQSIVGRTSAEPTPTSSVVTPGVTSSSQAMGLSLVRRLQMPPVEPALYLRKVADVPYAGALDGHLQAKVGRRLMKLDTELEFLEQDLWLSLKAGRRSPLHKDLEDFGVFESEAFGQVAEARLFEEIEANYERALVGDRGYQYLVEEAMQQRSPERATVAELIEWMDPKRLQHNRLWREDRDMLAYVEQMIAQRQGARERLVQRVKDAGWGLWGPRPELAADLVRKLEESPDLVGPEGAGVATTLRSVLERDVDLRVNHVAEDVAIWFDTSAKRFVMETPPSWRRQAGGVRRVRDIAKLLRELIEYDGKELRLDLDPTPRTVEQGIIRVRNQTTASEIAVAYPRVLANLDARHAGANFADHLLEAMLDDAARRAGNSFSFAQADARAPAWQLVSQLDETLRKGRRPSAELLAKLESEGTFGSLERVRVAIDRLFPPNAIEHAGRSVSFSRPVSGTHWMSEAEGLSAAERATLEELRHVMHAFANNENVTVRLHFDDVPESWWLDDAKVLNVSAKLSEAQFRMKAPNIRTALRQRGM